MSIIPPWYKSLRYIGRGGGNIKQSVQYTWCGRKTASSSGNIEDIETR